MTNRELVTNRLDNHSHYHNNANHSRYQATNMTTPIKPPSPPASPASTAERPRLASESLLRGASAVEIEHAGQRYLLRVTRENKLILTK